MCEHVTHPEHWPGDVGDLYATHDGLHLPADGTTRLTHFDGTAAHSLRDAPYGTCVP